MAIEYSDQAIEDLEQIDRFTFERWGDRQAVLYLSKLRRVILHLEQYPEMGHVIPNLKPNARLLSAEEHIIVYRQVDNSVIRIIRVLHKNREFDSVLGGN